MVYDNQDHQFVLYEEASDILRRNVMIYLADHGMSVSGLADRLRMNRSTLCRILNRERQKEIELSLAENIADALEVQIEHLLVEQPLDIEPEMKEFLKYPENREHVKALMYYLEHPDNALQFITSIRKNTGLTPQ